MEFVINRHVKNMPKKCDKKKLHTNNVIKNYIYISKEKIII